MSRKIFNSALKNALNELSKTNELNPESTKKPRIPRRIYIRNSSIDHNIPINKRKREPKERLRVCFGCFKKLPESEMLEVESGTFRNYSQYLCPDCSK
jgi:hypothetical protein